MFENNKNGNSTTSRERERWTNDIFHQKWRAGWRDSYQLPRSSASVSLLYATQLEIVGPFANAVPGAPFGAIHLFHSLESKTFKNLWEGQFCAQ